MIPSKIENIIVKFMAKSASADELEQLDAWISLKSNKETFKSYIKTHFAITMSMNELDPKQIGEKLLKQIRKEKRTIRLRRYRKVFKYAAIVVVLFGIGLFFKNELITRDDLNEKLVPNEDKITLELDNGKMLSIDDDGSTQILNENGEVVGTQEGKKLSYRNQPKNSKPIFNTLKIPYGKRFDIELSDGTKIFLNSGSSITYPVTFSGPKREVYLNGEAFFDVAKDKSHPFIVNAEELEIKVLGTKFSVLAYPEDTNADVVLVEGSVGLSGDTKSKVPNTKDNLILEPGHLGSFNKSNKTISSNRVNTALYTSWMNGDIMFRDEPFKNIVKRLERQYNIIIILNNTELAEKTFNATFEVEKESLEEVLYYFNKVHQINYTIVNNKVVIN